MASQYAPPPAVDPTMGGCCGAFFAVAVIMIFSAVAGFEAGGIPIIVTVAIFFILPILYLNSQQKRYRKSDFDRTRIAYEDKVNDAYFGGRCMR